MTTPLTTTPACSVTTPSACQLSIEHKGSDKHPRIQIEDADGKVIDNHYVSPGTTITVTEGKKLKAGAVLARKSKESAKSADIVGGLPRVTEIFEARNPREAAVMAEITGKIELRKEKKRGKSIVIIHGEGGNEVEIAIPGNTPIRAHTGDFVQAGDRLTDGALVPQDVLRIKGEEELAEYLLDEVQQVYRAQGVTINDKHIEVILSQMLRKVEVINPGDTGYLQGDVIDRQQLAKQNETISQSVRVVDGGDSGLVEGEIILVEDAKDIIARLEDEGKDPLKTKKCKPAIARPRLLGISRAALSSDSFLSGASFQETTKVLTEAALGARKDPLQGLKENVLLGHLIPVGTGFPAYQQYQVAHLGAALLDDPTEPEAIEEAVERAETGGAIKPEHTGPTLGQSKRVQDMLEAELNAKPNRRR